MTRCPWLHVFLDVPADLFDAAGRFWAAATGGRLAAPWPEHPEFRSVEPPTGSRYLHVQRHGGPPRLHLDLVTARVDAETARLAALGAVAGTRQRWWQVLRSPGGLPFCLVEETPGRARPDPVRWPDGHRSRVAELAVTAPAGGCDAERRFWRAATGWDPDRLDPAPTGPAVLVPPGGAPLRLAVRPGAAGDPVRARLGIDTDDPDAEVRRLVALGAVPAGAGLLRDPAGLPFRVAAG